MGTVHRLPPPGERRPRATDAGALRAGLEMPGWEEFTTARDRFFARLQADAEIHHAEAVAAAASEREPGRGVG